MIRTSSRPAVGAAAIVFLAIGLTGVLTTAWPHDAAHQQSAEPGGDHHDSSQHAHDAAPHAHDSAQHGHGSAQHAHDAASQLHAGVDLIAARRLYLDRCSGCHGPRGQGGDMVRIDFADPQALLRLTAEAVRASLAGDHGGRLGTPLSEAERDTVTDFLRNYLMLPAPDADTSIGRAIYARSCSVCHGDRGDAASWAKNSLNPPPADFTSHGLEQLSREKMIDAVTFGEDGTAMVAFAVQLSREEIAATVDYIRTAFMVEGAGPGDAAHGHGGDHATKHHETLADDAAPFPGGLVGDPVWGKAFYEANCAECHGANGDGQGRRAYFMIKKPENFRSREARAELDRPKLHEEISAGVTGSTMPAWDKVLTPQEIANVAEYVYRAFLQPDRFEPVGTSLAPGWSRAEPAPADAKKN